MNKKRIELHCHSKFGGFSSLYPGEIMQYLSGMDMPAFAVTDELNIAAFPEIEAVWNTGNYTSRPIYGMEMILQGSDNEITDTISVLIKNETGKENLYRFISANISEVPYPVYELDALLDCRAGLLLGSGTDKGRVYKKALLGVSNEDLSKEISIYDYVEVLPFAEYEGINKRIIDISDRLGIPVVAVSDARYIDKIGRKSLEIMNHWNKDKETLCDNHFWNTDEMLEAFKYLGADKAYEIVVENTHKIANMCESIQVCPKDKYYPVIEGADEKIKTLCEKALTEKYPEDMPVVHDRLDFELDALNKTGMNTYVLQIKELLEKSNLKPSEISFRGTSAGSLVLYLLGICDIDPIEHKLEPEMIFGINGQRAIDIDINIPSGLQLDVIGQVDSLTGIEKYLWAGTLHYIGDPLAQAMIDKYMEDKELYFEEDVQDKLRCTITGNCVGRGKHPGGVLVFPTGCEYTNLMPSAKVSGGFETTYFEYHSLDRSFWKFDLLKHDIPEMLMKLSKQTGISLDTVPADDGAVLGLFEADNDGKVTKCDDLPEFKSEFVRNIIATLKPRSFEELVKVSGLSHGTRVWDGNGEILVKEKNLGIRDIIATRDDIFDYNLALGIDRQTSFEIAEAVRKGIVSRGKNAKWQGWKKLLIEAGAPDWYIWTCEQIRYLFPRAHTVSYVTMNMRLGWFKVYYPDDFNQVMKEYEELS